MEHIDGLMDSSKVSNLIESDSSSGISHNAAKVLLADDPPSKKITIGILLLL